MNTDIDFCYGTEHRQCATCYRNCMRDDAAVINPRLYIMTTPPPNAHLGYCEYYINVKTDDKP